LKLLEKAQGHYVHGGVVRRERQAVSFRDEIESDQANVALAASSRDAM